MTCVSAVVATVSRQEPRTLHSEGKRRADGLGKTLSMFPGTVTRSSFRIRVRHEGG